MASVPAANRNPRLPARIRAVMTVEIPAAMTAVETLAEAIPAAVTLAVEMTAEETPAEKNSEKITIGAEYEHKDQ